MRINIGTREPDSSASSVTFDHSSAHERRDWDAERRLAVLEEASSAAILP